MTTTNDKVLRKQQIKKEAFLDALEKSMGIMTQAAKTLGINRVTAYQWMKKDPEFADKVEEIQNLVLDFTESKLYELIEEKNPTAIIFLLKTKGRDRGYVERHEIGGVNGKPLDVTINVMDGNDYTT